jgi:hypothetical protein
LSEVAFAESLELEFFLAEDLWSGQLLAENCSGSLSACSLHQESFSQKALAALAEFPFGGRAWSAVAWRRTWPGINQWMAFLLDHFRRKTLAVIAFSEKMDHHKPQSIRVFTGINAGRGSAGLGPGYAVSMNGLYPSEIEY